MKVSVSCQPVEVPDGKGLSRFAAVTPLFAQAGTDAAQRSRDCQIINGDFRRAPKIPVGDACHKSRDVQCRRATGSAGPDAISYMIGKQQFKCGLSRGAHFVRICMNNHAVGSRGCAGRRQIGSAFNFYGAQVAGCRRRIVFHLAECGDANSQHTRGFENRRPFFNRNIPSVNSQCNHMQFIARGWAFFLF